jgi:nicotinamidase-related amidase
MKTAMLIIDLQNDFASDDGAFWCIQGQYPHHRKT